MSKLICVTVGFFSLIIAMAQPAKQYSFTHYSTTSGLLSNQVNSAVQDEDGYIWLGTTEGLQRFDGTRYKTFRHKENYSSGIPSNPVWQLLIDKKQRLWLLMADGKVGIFDTKKFTFHEFNVKFKKAVSPNTSLKHLITDEFGNIFYLVSGSEVITLDEKFNEFSYTHNFFKQKEEWNIADFIQEPGTQKYWLSIAGAGMAVYNKTTGTLSYKGNNIDRATLIEQYDDLSTNNYLYFDRQHRLWSVSWNHIPYVSCYDFNTNKLVIRNASLAGDLKTYHEIKGFFQQQDGTIWIRGLLVLAKYLAAENKFKPIYNGYMNEQSIAYEMVHCLYEDREKNIWVCTDNNGLYRFNPTTEFFTNVKHVNRITGNKGEGSTMSFMPTRWGTVLAGTWGDGLYQYDQHYNPIPLNIKGIENKGGPSVWNMCASSDSNTIWMSAQPGIYAIDQANRIARFYNPSVLKNNTTRQIAEDKYGNLWLGTQSSGVFKWTAAKGKNNFDDGMIAYTAIPPVQVNKITIDSKGFVWIATPENGIYVIDPNSDKISMRFSDSSREENKLPERGVSSILEYDDSLIIIATATRIVTYNRLINRTTIIGGNGMIAGFITAVEKDKNGYLWLTSTSGLYRINFRKKIFVKFNRKDGINNDHFTQSASCKLPDGQLLFGSTNDFVLFDPSKIHIASATPGIKITEFKVMGESRSVDSLMQLKEIELGYQDNSLSIEYSPLVYNSPFLIKYKLDGLDKYWKSSDNNEAIYSFLPAKSYTFLLKIIDEEGNETIDKMQLKIRVSPPFWKTWWFYSLLVLAVVALLFWLDKERMKRKRAIQKMRSDIADNLYQEVNTALSNINILSEIAKMKADKDPEKSKDYIQQINSKSQQMIIAMDDMLWGINPENDSMQKTIERFKEHIDSLRNRFHVKIDLLVDEKVEKLNMNMKLRQNVFWLLRGGSTNIVRTGATNCHIHIGYRKPNLIYTLEFDSDQMDILQMNNLLQRQELSAKIEEVNGTLNSQLHNTRSVIELSIPV